MLHIIITDTETGKVIHEADTNAIVGGYKTKAGSDSIIVAKCSDFDLACTIMAARGAIDAIEKQKGPTFALMTKLLPSIIDESKKETVELKEEKSEEATNE